MYQARGLNRFVPRGLPSGRSKPWCALRSGK